MAKYMLGDPNTVLICSVEDILKAEKERKLGIVHRFQLPNALEGNLDWAWHFKDFRLGYRADVLQHPHPFRGRQR